MRISKLLPFYDFNLTCPNPRVVVTESMYARDMFEAVVSCRQKTQLWLTYLLLHLH
jgi:hypothetical protein